MDVRCTKCGIEYEFDDAKVTAAGVTVKCTSCGHVFKVKREESSVLSSSPSFGPLPGSKGDGAEWMVKRVDGQVFRFKELTTLQKWIVERKVGRDDEISKTGKTWKRLGEIAELASFFQVVDAANAAGASSGTSSPGQTQPWTQRPDLPSKPPSPSLPSPSLPSPSQPSPSQPSPSQPSPSPIMSLSMPPTSSASAPPEVGAANIHDDAAPPALSAPLVPVRDRVERAGRGAKRADVDLDALDDDDPVLQMIKRRKRNAALAVVFVVLAACGLGAAVFWPQLSGALGLTPPPAIARPAVDDALRALRDDHLGALRGARSALDAATDPVELATQIRLDVAIAAHLRAQAWALDLVAAAPVEASAASAARTSAKAKQEEAAASLAKAYGTLTKVRAEAPQLVELHLASAAYQLAKGALAEQRTDLENARAATRVPGADPSLASAVDAEIAVGQALAEAAAGLQGDAAAASAALERVPAGGDDGRLRHARAALAVAALPPAPGEPDLLSARGVVSAMRAPDERRELLTRILDAKAPSGAALVDAGVVVRAADAGVEAGADAGVVTSARDAGPAKVEEDLEGASYEVIMQKAERARVNEKSKTAYELFVRATKLKPGAKQPWLGLGWAAMDLGRNNEAIRAFQKALGLDGELADAQFGLAEALKFAGRTDEAKSAYQAYLQMDPNGRDAAVARRALESLQ